MSETAEQLTPCTRAQRDDELGCNPDQIIELLSDDDARAVFLSAEEPTTVGEVSEEHDLPASTAYRKVEQLHESGLLTQLNRQSGETPAYYVRSIDHVSVTYDEPLRIECTRKGKTLYCEH
ncbi:helix-turn-helix domain-containing protein [Haloarchaeobius amylolyticus]|uniref:Helix-turn-helix domain-containing protein n=1 Tax=Haloarchaeobius amylolyticus TaxID=1198296 RepID=A0ABD6BLG3_9EURY